MINDSTYPLYFPFPPTHYPYPTLIHASFSSSIPYPSLGLFSYLAYPYFLSLSTSIRNLYPTPVRTLPLPIPLYPTPPLTLYNSFPYPYLYPVLPHAPYPVLTHAPYPVLPHAPLPVLPPGPYPVLPPAPIPSPDPCPYTHDPSELSTSELRTCVGNKRSKTLSCGPRVPEDTTHTLALPPSSPILLCLRLVPPSSPFSSLLLSLTTPPPFPTSSSS